MPGCPDSDPYCTNTNTHTSHPPGWSPKYTQPYMQGCIDASTLRKQGRIAHTHLTMQFLMPVGKRQTTDHLPRTIHIHSVRVFSSLLNSAPLMCCSSTFSTPQTYFKSETLFTLPGFSFSLTKRVQIQIKFHGMTRRGCQTWQTCLMWLSLVVWMRLISAVKENRSFFKKSLHYKRKIGRLKLGICSNVDVW